LKADAAIRRVKSEDSADFFNQTRKHIFQINRGPDAARNRLGP
jgi:hypothetical protein